MARPRAKDALLSAARQQSPNTTPLSWCSLTTAHLTSGGARVVQVYRRRPGLAAQKVNRMELINSAACLRLERLEVADHPFLLTH